MSANTTTLVRHYAITEGAKASEAWLGEHGPKALRTLFSDLGSVLPAGRGKAIPTEAAGTYADMDDAMTALGMSKSARQQALGRLWWMAAVATFQPEAKYDAISRLVKGDAGNGWAAKVACEDGMSLTKALAEQRVAAKAKADAKAAKAAAEQGEQAPQAPEAPQAPQAPQGEQAPQAPATREPQPNTEATPEAFLTTAEAIDRAAEAITLALEAIDNDADDTSDARTRLEGILRVGLMGVAKADAKAKAAA